MVYGCECACDSKNQVILTERHSIIVLRGIGAFGFLKK